MANKNDKWCDYKLLGVLEMTKEEIQKIITTLESIEVHGRANLDKLLACIMFLDGKLKESEEEDG